MNVKRGVARTAFSMAADALRRRRCLLVTCRRSRQFAGRWHARNMRQPKVHRSATNLCMLTIVNEALYHNPNIHLQVRASQPAAECRARSAVDREARQAVATRARCWSCGRQLLTGRCAGRDGRRRRAGPGRGRRRGGERRGHPHRQARRCHPRGDRSQQAGQLSPRQPRRAAAARDRSARGRLDRRRRTRPKRSGWSRASASGSPAPACRASSSTWRSRSRSIACSSCRRAARTVTAS